MLSINFKRLAWIGLLCAGLTAATTAQATDQMFTGEWYTRSFGNECNKLTIPAATPNHPCFGQELTGPSEFYTVFAIPAGQQCNNLWPRCAFASTPTNGITGTKNAFHPVGGYGIPNTTVAPFCAPWANFQGNGATARPAKGETILTGGKNNPIPPLYRNYKFFTASTGNAMPAHTYCNGSQTAMGGLPAKTPGLTTAFEQYPGPVVVGSPLSGAWNGSTTAPKGDFTFAAAPYGNIKAGIRLGQGTRSKVTKSGASLMSAMSGLVGDFQNVYPYVYSYSYATQRNDAGDFGAGQGPGNFFHDYGTPAGDAQITIKEGPNRFGGTMRLLGLYTTKVCYFRNKACSLGTNNWRYESVGASAVLTTGAGSTALKSGLEVTHEAFYYHTGMDQRSTVMLEGRRFPWTTGSVTVKATGRGPHKTIHWEHGYDNRNPITGKGTIQLVSPILTRWLQPAANFETGGIGILRIKFVPEPQTWAILIAGVSLLGVGYRMRGR